MAENILKAFFETADKNRDNPCFHFKKDGNWQSLLWGEVASLVCRLTAGLESIGVKKGDRVAIYSFTTMEWIVADLAILSCGAITIPLYQTFPKDRIEHILKDANINIVLVENEVLKNNITDVCSRISRPVKIIMMNGEGESTLSGLVLRGAKAPLEALKERVSDIDKNDIATIVYTSGTTGVPKGVVLTHGNILSEVSGVCQFYHFPKEWIGLLCLPLSHVLGRLMEFHHLMDGYQIAFIESYDKFPDNSREIKPHFILGVPRMLEKMYERISSHISGLHPLKRKLFDWGLSIGKEVGSLDHRHLQIPFSLKIKKTVASQLIFKKIKARLGGKVTLFVSGGAPLSADLAKFFQAIGVIIMEGYGLTETFAAVTVNRPSDYHFGTVGKPIPGVEVKLSEDGEILVRGPTVFREYLNLPDETREVITSDGWFKTGDVGEFSRDGFLRITDRKKDFIITAGGENIAPQMIETSVMESKFINYCMVYGDRKKYLSALLTLNTDAIKEYASQSGINGDLKNLATHPKVNELINSVIKEKNTKFARYETIKKFIILDHDFSQETGELTPTLKIRRRFTIEKYREVLEGLYRE